MIFENYPISLSTFIIPIAEFSHLRIKILNFKYSYWQSKLKKNPKMEGGANAETEQKIGKDAVLRKSEKLPDETPIVKGYEWNKGIDYNQLLGSYLHSGFQATNFGLAVNEINKMVSKLK